MSERATAWTFVCVQALLLAALWATPTAGLWGRPGWLLATAAVVFWAGLAWVVLAAAWLRNALTPLPTPRPGSDLCMTGPYRFSRHPIYLGVLVASFAMTLRRAHLGAVLVFLALVALLEVKARWEEVRLNTRYRYYRQYAARTGRILPRIR